MHQPHQHQQQPQSRQHQSQQHNINARNHQQQHHHSQNQGPSNQQQPHPQMHHPQSHQGQPMPQQQQQQQHQQQQQPQPQLQSQIQPQLQPQIHHQQQISHPHNQHHPHQHHHSAHQPQHNHPSTQQQQQQQQHLSYQQPAGPTPTQQHSLPISGSIHPATQTQPSPHHLSHAHHQHSAHQQQPHHAQAHAAHIPLSDQPHPQQLQQQLGTHTGQHSQPQTALHHATGAMQHHRQQHHALTHHQHHQHAHHHQPPQPHTSVHHSLSHQAAHQIMMNHGQYPPANMVYSHHAGQPPFSAVPLAPTGFNAPAAGHRPDATSSLNTQQPTNINPNNMPPINQMASSVISTVATGTTNVHHQPSSLPVMDPTMQTRIPMNHQHAYMISAGYQIPQFMPMYAPVPGHYNGPMQPSPAYPRLPGDMSLRHPYDQQNQANIAKVPLSQAPTIGTKLPASISTVTGISSTPSTTATTVRKRERKPAQITNPTTGQIIMLEPKSSGDLSTAKQEPTTTTTDSTTPITTVTTVSAAPTSVTSPQVTDTDVKTPTASKDPNHSFEVKMQNLNLDGTSNDATQTSSDDTTKSPVTTNTPPASSFSPKIVPVSTNGPANTNEDSELVMTEEPLSSATASSVVNQSITGSLNQTEPCNSSLPPCDTKDVDLSLADNQPEVHLKDSIDISDGAPANKSEVVSGSIQEPSVEDSDESAAKGASVPNDHPSTETVEPTVLQKSEKMNPKLPYQPGQYSPLHPDGKRKYNREFLMAVLNIMAPDLESINVNSLNHDRVDILAPPYMTIPQSIYRDLPASRRSSQQALVRPKRIIATSSLQPEIELKTSENAWKPELEEEKTQAVEGGEMDTKRLIKVFRGLLNKLTPQKYDSIIAKVAALDLDGPERLSSVIDLVFDKAVDEPGFCELYAKMSKVIAAKHDKFFFHLVKRCQEEFETSDLYHGLNVDKRKEDIENETDALKKKIMSEELYEDMRLRRRKYLGTIKLIGEMYKFGLLIPKIIRLCMKHLIEGASNENLECLCSLLATVGAKMASEKDVLIKESLNCTLKVLHEFAHSKKLEDHFVLESRIKFKILDTIDLSRKSWRPRMVENNPKKIEEIHQEIKEDKLRQQLQNHSSQNRNMMKNDDRDRHRRQGGSYNNRKF